MKKLISLLVCLAFLLSFGISDSLAKSSGGKSRSHSYKSSRSNSKSVSSTKKKSNPVYVKGYYKKNGTYVKPHNRTKADKSKENNWSTKGNINPATGKRGTIDLNKPKTKSK